MDISKIKTIIYRPSIYNLQTRTVTFPHQEKLIEKVDGGQNTKNPQIKNYPCPRNVMLYRPGQHNLQTRKKLKSY